MAAIKVKKDGQIYSFGLTTDASVTNGNYIHINVNGTTHYARIGTDSTPLKVKKGGQTYSVQYNAAAFNTFYKAMYVNDKTSFDEWIFIPKGRYRVNINGDGNNTYEVYISESKNYNLVGYMKTSPPYAIYFSIKGIKEKERRHLNRSGSITVERIGD